MKNKPFASLFSLRTIKALFLVFALIVAYLYALNGRYTQASKSAYFDKWTKTLLIIERFDYIK